MASQADSIGGGGHVACLRLVSTEIGSLKLLLSFASRALLAFASIFDFFSENMQTPNSSSAAASRAAAERKSGTRQATLANCTRPSIGCRVLTDCEIITTL